MTDAAGSAVGAIHFVAELSYVHPAVGSAEQLLTLMAERAATFGYAGPGLAAALIEREQAYPTGLPTPVPSAIPHADAGHVLRPALAAALLDEPVRFGEMGARDRSVSARLVVVMLVNDPASQVDVLVRLLAVLQRPDLAVTLDGCADAGDLAARLQALLTPPTS